MPDGKNGLAHLDFIPENALQYFVERRGDNKRAYVYDYKEAKTCDHPEIRALARGGIVYRCLKCNYVFHITGVYAQPLHNEVIMAAFTLLVFSKEHGSDALGEVLRRPIGQHDGSPHKPVLPEGYSFTDVLALLDGIDVTAEDGGAAQLYKALDEVWVSPETRQKAIENAESQTLQSHQLQEASTSGTDGADDTGTD
jgi:hypothetical protein